MSFRLVYGPTWAIQAGSGRALQATGQALAAGAGAAAEHVHQVGAQSWGRLAPGRGPCGGSHRRCGGGGGGGGVGEAVGSGIHKAINRTIDGVIDGADNLTLS